MKSGWFRYTAIILLFAAQGLLFLVIPSILPQIYLSPDETAVAVTAREFGTTWSFRLPDKILKDGPWIHPRSFVTEGEALVPVGFLGMPLLAGLLWKLFGEFGLLLLTPLLALSCAYPLWRSMRRYGFAAQTVTVSTWLSFPMVIMYANRGLFPNLPVVCLTIWSVFLLWRKPKMMTVMIAGLLFGLAMAIRPMEFLWAAVWIGLAWTANPELPNLKHGKKYLAAFLGSAALLPLITALAAWQTYGAPWLIGYWLRDPTDAATQMNETASILKNPGRVWPFGFHPRAILNNAENYLVYILGPWVATALVATALWLKRKSAKPVILAGAWTALVLWLVYGNTVYQDHVGYDVVSVGNSYLRYLLPLAPFFAIAAGAVAVVLLDKLSKHKGKFAVALLAACLVSLGIWTAFAKDDEGLNASVPELMRYESIRQETYKLFGRDTIVVSDRSDKVFFPVTRAVSPIPDDGKLADIAGDYPGQTLLFDTTYSQEKIDDMLLRGFMLNPVFQSKNQTLYVVIYPPLKDMMDYDPEPQP